MIDADGRLARDAGGQLQLIIVPGRGLVTALGFDDDEKRAIPFEVAIAVASGAKQFDAAHLEILQKPAVMQIPHGVDLWISHANDQRVLEKRLRGRWGGHAGKLPEEVQGCKVKYASEIFRNPIDIYVCVC
jgi:hypothetical protein